MAVADRYIPLKERFTAWWNGEDVPTGGAGRSASMAIEIDEETTGSDTPWSEARLEMMERIWGEAFLEPGGERQARKQLGILSLNAKQSILDLTAGLAGTAISIADKHGLWMEALEPNPELMRAGQRRCAIAGLGKRVALRQVDYSEYRFPSKRYDAIYSRERLFSLPDKSRIVDGSAGALKPGGQILVTDFLRNEDVGGGALVEAWPAREGEELHFWTFEQYRRSFEAQEISVMPLRDITDEYVDKISTAWAKIPRLLEGTRLTRRQVALLMQEGDLWLKRMKTLESGKVSIGRIHAQAPG